MDDAVNNIDYEAQGWHLVDDIPVIEYRSQYVDPNHWWSQRAVKDNGDHAVIWWYMDGDTNAEDDTDTVTDWYKCHDIEPNSSDN